MDRRPKSVRYLSPKPTRRVNRTSTRVFSSAMNFDEYKKPSQRGFAINNRETTGLSKGVVPTPTVGTTRGTN